MACQRAVIGQEAVVWASTSRYTSTKASRQGEIATPVAGPWMGTKGRPSAQEVKKPCSTTRLTDYGSQLQAHVGHSCTAEVRGVRQGNCRGSGPLTELGSGQMCWGHSAPQVQRTAQGTSQGSRNRFLRFESHCKSAKVKLSARLSCGLAPAGHTGTRASRLGETAKPADSARRGHPRRRRQEKAQTLYGAAALLLPTW